MFHDCYTRNIEPLSTEKNLCYKQFHWLSILRDFNEKPYESWSDPVRLFTQKYKTKNMTTQKMQQQNKYKKAQHGSYFNQIDLITS